MNSSGWIEHTQDRCNTRGKTGETTKPHYGYGAVSRAFHWKAPEVKCIYSSILKPVVTELLVFYGQSCTTHWGFRNYLFRGGGEEASLRYKTLQDSLRKIINYWDKTNNSKAKKLVFHWFKFPWKLNHWISDIIVSETSCKGKCKIPMQLSMKNDYNLYQNCKDIAQKSDDFEFQLCIDTIKGRHGDVGRCDKCCRRMIFSNSVIGNSIHHGVYWFNSGGSFFAITVLAFVMFPSRSGNVAKNGLFCASTNWQCNLECWDIYNVKSSGCLCQHDNWNSSYRILLWLNL